MPQASELLLKIDEESRRRFESGWATERPEPIEACLPADDDPAYLPTLEELVCIELEFAWKRWSRARRQEPDAALAETVVGPSRLEKYLARFKTLNEPEVCLRLVRHEFAVRSRFGDRPPADEYRDRFPHLAESGRLTQSLLRADEDTWESPPAETIGPAPAASRDAQGVQPRRFGGYELLEKIGAGGMGVVYRARQLGADRTVALKVIRQDRLRDLPAEAQTESIERFRTEALAAARLQHVNIATVYEVGEVDGQPFYSMQYVEGGSLADLVGGGPLPNRRAAECIDQVARAIQAAHTAGIVHRDLKPQNVLVDAPTGRPLVCDFGLAKLREKSEGLTHEGEVLGTPSHMVPEQARDSGRATEGSDIYALGATLYHLVTGRPPFQAATPLETIRQVIDQDPAPPSRLNAAVDRDLETICLKCLDKDPAKRYESAEALADDLRRYLKGEPIHARPVGAVERVARWCRRNPVAASGIGMALAGVLAGIVALSVGYAKAKAALQESDESHRLARQTVNDLFIDVSENVLLNKPGMQPLRHKLLGRTLPYYQRFVEQGRDDPDLRAELGVTWYRIGKIREEIVSLEEALSAYENARRIQRRLHDESPDSADHLRAFAATVNAIGTIHLRMQRPVEALAAFAEARDHRLRLVAIAPRETEHIRLLANSMMNIGLVYKAREEFDRAREHMNDAQDLRTKLLRDLPADKGLEQRIHRDLGKGYYNLANIELEDESGEMDRARHYLAQAIDAFELVVAANPDDFYCRRDRAVCCRRLAEISTDPIRAADLYARAATQFERLFRENPRVGSFEEELATVLYKLAVNCEHRGETVMAVETFRRAVGLFERLVTASSPAKLRLDYARALRGLAHLQQRLQRTAEAEEALRIAMDLFEDLIAENPGDTLLSGELDDLRAQLGSLRKIYSRARDSASPKP